jgi:hypothetical protein
VPIKPVRAVDCGNPLPVAAVEGMMRWRVLGVLLCLVPVFGCSAFGDPMGRERALEGAQLRYTQHVRWGEFDAASEFVDPSVRESFLAQAPSFDGIRITDYDIGRIDYEGNRQAATVHVIYHAYSLATAQEHRIEEQQRWFRPGKDNTWWVQPKLAGLLEPFAGATR